MLFNSIKFKSNIVFTIISLFISCSSSPTERHYLGNLARTGNLTQPIQHAETKVLLDTETGYLGSLSSPALTDEFCYFGGSSPISRMVISYPLRKIDKFTGEVVWEKTFDENANAPILIGSFLYTSITTDDSDEKCSIVAIDEESGTILWEKEFEGIVGPIESYDGSLYFNLGGVSNAGRRSHQSWGYLVSMNSSDGSVNWKFKSEGPFYYSVPVVRPSTIYTGGNEGILYAIDRETGTINWTYKANERLRGVPTFIEDNLFFYDTDERIYSLNALTGNEIWSVDHGINYSSDFIPNPLAYYDGALFMSLDQSIVSFSALDGSPKWQFSDVERNSLNRRTGAQTTPVAINGNMLIFGSNNGKLYALDTDSGELLWQIDFAEPITSSIIIEYGIAYITTNRGKFVRLQLSRTPPKFDALPSKVVLLSKNEIVKLQMELINDMKGLGMRFAEEKAGIIGFFYPSLVSSISEDENLTLLLRRILLRHNTQISNIVKNEDSNELLIEVSTIERQLVCAFKFSHEHKGEVTGKIGIIIDDFGYIHNRHTANFIDYAEKITFSVIPGEKFSRVLAEEGHRAGHEIIVHMPMEPENYNGQDNVEYILLRGIDEKEAQSRIRKAFQSIPHAIGMNNSKGASATVDSTLMKTVAEELKERGMYFVDSYTTPKTVAKKVMTAVGVRAATRKVWLDNSSNPTYIRRQLKNLAASAEREGYAIGIGHVGDKYPNTLEILKKEIPLLKEKGFEFLFISEILSEIE